MKVHNTCKTIKLYVLNLLCKSYNSAVHHLTHVSKVVPTSNVSEFELGKEDTKTRNPEKKSSTSSFLERGRTQQNVMYINERTNKRVKA